MPPSDSRTVGRLDGRLVSPTVRLSDRPTLEWEFLLEPTGRPGAENMAVDWSLLIEAARSGRAFLRLYRWDPPCLSLGRNQPAIDARGLAVVRRPTGGRAVWHEHEVTYAVAAPLHVFGSLRESYLGIHERLATALRSMGADVQLAGRPAARPSGRQGSCFASAAGGEIVVGKRKVVGSAQVRHGDALLQHGSILLDGAQDVVRAVSRQPSAVRGETTLRETLGRPVTFEEVTGAIMATWGEPLVPSGRPAVLPSYEVETWRR
jgi:lipoyl(octanoyl) transferase